MDQELDPEQDPREWIDAIEMDVIRSFAEHGVRFIVIGGRAVHFHGHARPAKDLDLLVEVSRDNWGNLAAALQPLGAGVPPFDELADGKRYQAHLRFYPTVEFLTAINGVSFQDAWVSSVATTFQGIPLRVLSKEHVIASKRGSSRSVDIADINVLKASPSDDAGT